MMGAMTVDEIFKDRIKFSTQVFDIASTDLFNMGIQVISYTLKDIKDEDQYMVSLGKDEIHCKCLQGITGSLQGFPVVGKPCNIYRLRGNPIIIMGFPRNL